MPQLPVLSGREAPDRRQLDRGLLRGLIRDAGLTVEQFMESLD